MGALALIYCFPDDLAIHGHCHARGRPVRGALLAAGIMGHIAIQVILNIAVVTNSIPNTGITLPFVSYGGTSVCFLLAGNGHCLKRIRSDKAVAKAPRKASLHMIIYNRCREEQAFRREVGGGTV